jgi:hypothetical protein
MASWFAATLAAFAALAAALTVAGHHAMGLL